MGDPFVGADPARLRRHPGSKWTRYSDDVLPAWVAEMDLPLCPVVRDAVDALMDSGTVGYPGASLNEALADAFVERSVRRAGWHPDAALVRPVTGVIATLGVLVRRFTEPGDEVVLQTPVFPPFAALVEALGRRIVAHPADLVDGTWRYDPARLEALIGDRTRMIVIVNPHNPLGRVFTRDELAEIGQVATRHGLLVVADEVHADLALDVAHTPVGSVDGDLAARTVTLTSAVKSHNLAGFRCGVAHFGTAELAATYDGLDRHIFWEVSNLGIAATVAAWRDGDDWLAEVMAAVEVRRGELGAFLAEHLPEVAWVPGEATYLAWLDFVALGLGPDAAAFFERNALVALSPGGDYGAGYGSCVRLNFGTSAALLSEILERMVTAIDLKA